ncbi:MAG: response regulator [Ignavibacteriaceae bacterium]|nr:response regulator [Ignavibacteriaceae bacterium]
MLPDEKKKILVVDDDLTIRKLIKHHLIKNQYDVLEAQDAIEGYEQLNTNNIDLVLCDVVMEGIDGFTFCQKVRQEEKYKVLPFIFVTARNSHEDKERAHEVGGDELITKPFDLKDLLLRVQTLLKRADIFKVHGVKKNISESFTKQVPRVLLVDDDPTLTKLFSHSLKKENYECDVANSAIEALTLAKNTQPDIIVSDIMMPNIDGYTFRRMVLEDLQLKSVPFVFLTSKNNEQDILDAYDLEITDYVLKTSGTKVIVAKLSAIINSLGKERQKIVSELNSAVDNMRVKVVPDKSPEFGDFIINQWHQPYQGIPGGDFIDYFSLNDQNMAIVLGDVMGKKWGAWYFTFAYAGLVRSAVRMVLQNTEDFVPSKILQQVNESVYKDSKVSEVFTTLSVVILNKEKLTLKYSGAGDLPLIYKNNLTGKVEKIATKGLLLGFAENGNFQDVTVNLNKGDSVFLVTDGIMDSRNPQGEAFGNQKFNQILNNLGADADDFNIMKQQFESFTGGKFEDDVSMINIKLPK